jgi:hypothetical protein
MGNTRDPFDVLSDHNPVAANEVPDAGSAPARRLLNEITAPRIPDLARRRRVRRVIAIAAAALLLAAAAWATLVRDVTEPSGIGCYQTDDLDSARVVVRPTGEAAVESCIGPWRDGTLTNSDIPPGSIPPLTGCVTDSGALAVFPTDDPEVCERLGLASPNPAPSEDIEPLIELQNRLVDYFSTTRCADTETAADDITDMVGDVGLNEWTIQTQPPHPERPCASFSLDAGRNTIHIVPIPASTS